MVIEMKIILERKVKNSRKVLYAFSDGTFRLEKYTAGECKIFLEYDNEQIARREFRRTTL